MRTSRRPKPPPLRRRSWFDIFGVDAKIFGYATPQVICKSVANVCCLGPHHAQRNICKHLGQGTSRVSRPIKPLRSGFLALGAAVTILGVVRVAFDPAI